MVSASFSRPFAVDRLAATGERSLEVRAETEGERAAIAARLRIPAVVSLSVEWTLRAGAHGAVEAEGVLDARVVQDCVVTLEPFEAPVGERFRVLFVPHAEGGDQDALPDGFDDDPEAPDAIAFDGPSIDLGDASVEQLALALDPFPRKPGAAFEGEVQEEAAEATSPFAVLQTRRVASTDGE